MDGVESTMEAEARAERATREKLIEALRAVIADAEELLKATASQAGEKIATVRAKAEESLKAAKARLAQEEAALLAKASSAAKATDEYVRANPWKSVGIGAFVGFLLGLLATRR
jgi:ElaB/YqjD/DUF883 family membrane-anchored ribosome-binding protein